MHPHSCSGSLFLTQITVIIRWYPCFVSFLLHRRIQSDWIKSIDSVQKAYQLFVLASVQCSHSNPNSILIALFVYGKKMRKKCRRRARVFFPMQVLHLDNKYRFIDDQSVRWSLLWVIFVNECRIVAFDFGHMRRPQLKITRRDFGGAHTTQNEHQFYADVISLRRKEIEWPMPLSKFIRNIFKSHLIF